MVKVGTREEIKEGGKRRERGERWRKKRGKGVKRKQIDSCCMFMFYVVGWKTRRRISGEGGQKRRQGGQWGRREARIAEGGGG
jgi:hypothetical protein